jgi:hypothetical protein
LDATLFVWSAIIMTAFVFCSIVCLWFVLDATLYVWSAIIMTAFNYSIERCSKLWSFYYSFLLLSLYVSSIVFCLLFMYVNGICYHTYDGVQ